MIILFVCLCGPAAAIAQETAAESAPHDIQAFRTQIKSYLQAGKWDQVESYIRDWLNQAGDNPSKAIVGFNQLADLYLEEENFESLDIILDEISRLQTHDNLSDAELIESLLIQSKAEEQKANFEQADTLAERAWNLATSTNGHRGQALERLFSLSLQQADFEKAARWLEVMNGLPGDQLSKSSKQKAALDLAIARCDVGSAEQQWKRIKHFVEFLQPAERVGYLQSAALLAELQFNPKLAEEWLLNALEVAQKEFPEMGEVNQDLKLALAESLVQQGKIDEAVAVVDEVVARQPQDPEASNSTRRADILRVSAAASLKSGALNRAEGQALRALEIASERYGPDHADTLKTSLLHADVLYARGRFDEAAQESHRVALQSRERYGKDNWFEMHSLYDRARYANDVGESELARSMARRAEALVEKRDWKQPLFLKKVASLKATIDDLPETQNSDIRLEEGEEVDAVDWMLDHVGDLMDGGDLKEAKKLLKTTSQRMGVDFAYEADVGLSLYKLRAENAIRKKAWDEAAADLEKLEEILQDSNDAEQDSRLYKQYAQVYAGKGDGALAADFMRKAAMLESAEGTGQPLALYDNLRRGLDGEAVENNAAYQRYQEVLRLAAQSLGSSSKSMANGEISGAEALFERALEIYEALVGPDHYEISYLLNNYAALLRQLGKPQEARKLEKRSRAIRELNRLRMTSEPTP